MIRRLRAIEPLPKGQLADALKSDPGILQHGLSPVARGLQADGATLDLLCVDPEGRLHVVAVAEECSPETVGSALAALSWASANASVISLLHGVGRVDSGLAPRLILVGPRFPESVVRLAGLLAAPVVLLECTVVELPGGELGLTVKPAGVAAAPAQRSAAPTHRADAVAPPRSHEGSSGLYHRVKLSREEIADFIAFDEGLGGAPRYE